MRIWHDGKAGPRIQLIGKTRHQRAASHETDARVNEAAKHRFWKTFKTSSQTYRQVVDTAVDCVEYVRCGD
jgi:hypothetical protein